MYIRCTQQLYVEPGIRQYLIRILNTIGLGLLWMAINSTAGIMLGYGIIEGSFKTGNLIFYCWFILSLSAFIWWCYRIWSKPIEIED